MAENKDNSSVHSISDLSGLLITAPFLAYIATRKRMLTDGERVSLGITAAVIALGSAYFIAEK